MIILEYPFEGIGYKVFYKKEGRYKINIIRPDKTRTTMLYSRYIMSIHLKRFLDVKKEHVDHIDGNKLNDDITNLQILTPKENNIKAVKELGLTSKKIKLKCPVCEVIFCRNPNNVNTKLKNTYM